MIGEADKIEIDLTVKILHVDKISEIFQLIKKMLLFLRDNLGLL